MHDIWIESAQRSQHWKVGAERQRGQLSAALVHPTRSRSARSSPGAITRAFMITDADVEQHYLGSPSADSIATHATRPVRGAGCRNACVAAYGVRIAAQPVVTPTFQSLVQHRFSAAIGQGHHRDGPKAG